jgi:hypothetical protein
MGASYPGLPYTENEKKNSAKFIVFPFLATLLVTRMFVASFDPFPITR